MMAAFYHFNNQSSNCSTAAAACSAARIFNRMDTAVVMAVSIIACLISLRLRIMALA